MNGLGFALILALVVGSLGCTTTMYNHVKGGEPASEAEPGEEPTEPSSEDPSDFAAQECMAVLHFGIGQTSGPCDIEGAAISLPGAAMIGEIFRTLGNVALAVIPGGAAAVVVERPAD